MEVEVGGVKVEMDTPIKTKPAVDLRDYLAEERTLLAWIRTGIALMGFGFVVARFGIFGDQADMSQQTQAVHPHEFSLWFGAALIAIGATANLFSAQRFAGLVGKLNRDQLADRSLSKQGAIVALFLALLGIAMAIYLTLFLAQPPGALQAMFARIGKAEDRPGVLLADVLIGRERILRQGVIKDHTFPRPDHVMQHGFGNFCR